MSSHVRAVTRPDLRSEMIDMTLNGAGRDPEFCGDLLCRKAFNDKLEYFGFAEGDGRIDVSVVHKLLRLALPADSV
jgi:hypothetical protein